jgi:hypothetical protein
VLLDEVSAYLFKAHTLVIHIQHIGDFRRGILHLGDSVYTGKFTLAVFAEVSLNGFVFAVFDYI